MKRTPIRRTTPLRRSSRLAPRNAKRKSERWTRQFGSPERVAFVRSLCCVACLNFGEIENHHITSRGAGGVATDIVPLCQTCHRAWHKQGRRTFCARWEIFEEDLRGFAAHTEEMWQKHVALAGIEA